MSKEKRKRNVFARENFPLYRDSSFFELRGSDWGRHHPAPFCQRNKPLFRIICLGIN